MELIYSMRRKPLKCEPPHFENNTDPDVVRPICTISSANIIAFSSLTELSDADGDTWGGHVYVCDLDTPWESHKVVSTVHPVSVLEWDGEGKQLLVATTVGDVSVYVQKDYLLNEWTCLYSASFPGEHIIKSVFFHNGRRIVALEKKPDVPISDRIQMLRSVPTLKGFGGAACEGACVITGTGLVGAFTPSSDSHRALVASDCLRAPRDHIIAAAFTHKNGSVLIAAAWRRGGRSGVRCAACAVSRAGGARASPLQLALQPLPTVYLLEDHLYSPPVSLTWCLREDTDSLLIVGSSLTLWKLAERSYPVHKLLCKGPVKQEIKGNTTPGGGQKTSTDCYNTVVWQQTAVWQVDGSEGATHVCSVRSALGAPHVVLATPRALHLLSRDNHHYVCSRVVGSSAAETGAATPPKKAKYAPAGATPATCNGSTCATVSCVEISQLGAVMVAVDTHSQLHVYKLPQPCADIPTPLSVQHTCMMLEYAMVSGYDYLDLLMTLKHNIVEAVYERLTENFQRQPQSFQQYYYHSWLKLRISLCSLVAGASGSAASLCALQLAQAAWAACGAALRSDDKPDAPLAALLDDHDHEKNLLALEAKAESLSEGAAAAFLALQALRRPLQRALDTALTALAAVVATASSPQLHQPHGYELWSDGAALSVLRKLVVCARACGRGGEALSRPLARLAAAPPTAAPKSDLLEECASLTAQMPARVWDALPRCAVAAPHGRTWPYLLEYGVEPEPLRFVPEPPPYAQCDAAPALAMDSIRYMYLGGGRRAARWRRCGRCGARALPAAMPARNAVQRAYDARFLPACRCGGKWTLYSNL